MDSVDSGLDQKVDIKNETIEENFLEGDNDTKIKSEEVTVKTEDNVTLFWPEDSSHNDNNTNIVIEPDVGIFNDIDTDGEEEDASSYFQPGNSKRLNERGADGNKVAICLFCQKKFNTRAILKEHDELVHRNKDDGTYNCPSCERTFPVLSLCKKHFKRVHLKLKTILTCPYPDCGRTYNSNTSMRDHIKGFHEGQRQQCTLCDRSFVTQQSLVDHVKIVHEKRRDYQCSICHKTFTRLQTLNEHLKFTHQQSPKPEVSDIGHGKPYSIANRFCFVCNKHVHKVKIHYETMHLKLRPHVCPKCQKTFTQKNHLAVHIEMVHEGKKDFECGQCGTLFCTKSALIRHLKNQHSDKKLEAKERIKCDKCDKTYARIDSLRIHVRENHGEHKCKICGQVFEAIVELNIHCKKHLKTKPRPRKQSRFQCDSCDKTFAKQSELKLHVKAVHEKSHQCDQCSRNFDFSYELKAHLSDDHDLPEVAHISIPETPDNDTSFDNEPHDTENDLILGM